MSDSDLEPRPPAAEEPSRLGPGYWRLWWASVVSNFGDGLSVIAYPWLASALTRNPVAIAGVAVATRIPWLLFTLPAGVITDRTDRRRLVLRMDLARCVITTAVAVAVLLGESGLHDPADIADGTVATPANGPVAIALVYVAAVLLGSAEVLRDNSAQTLMPSLVRPGQLERANGRLWGAEMVMNSFVGPPVAGLLLAVSFSLPLFIDAGSFAVAAALIFMISGDFSPRRAPGSGDRLRVERRSFRSELAEGFRWLWQHELFRPMAISLGIVNALMAMTQALQVLFAQEVLDLSAAGFGALGISFALGGVVGSFAAEHVTRLLGSGGSLLATIVILGFTTALIGLVPSVPLVFAMFAVGSFMGTVWNVVTVSLRQSLIPDELLGRVNSVYRFFGWGMMPIGSLVGGLIVVLAGTVTDRETSLRLTFLVSGGCHVGLFMYAAPRLNSARIEAAKRSAVVE